MEYNYLYNKNISPNEITEWDLSKNMGDKGFEIFKQPGFFLNLKPIPDAIEYLSKLMTDGYDILIVTCPPNGISMMDKKKWCEKYLSFIPKENIIMTCRKDLIKADLIFDDSPTNLESFNGIKVCMNRPYNKNAICDYRVDSWGEFYNLINRLNKGD